MSTYCISDVHGCYDEFMSLLKKIKFDNAQDTIYMLGDAIDRGPEPLKCLRFIKDTRGINYLQGNHDDMMIGYFDGDMGASYDWKRNGYETTLSQLTNEEPKEAAGLINWVRSRKYYKTLTVNGRKYFLSHAGLWADMSFNKQGVSDLVWSRSEFYKCQALYDYTCVFGHTYTPHIHGDSTEWGIWLDPIWHDKIGIDCGCVYGGALAALRLDDGKVFYVKNKKARKGIMLSTTQIPADFYEFKRQKRAKLRRPEVMFT